MLSPIELNDESCLSTKEIDDIGPKRMLTAEAETFELFSPQPRPQSDFGIRGCPAQFARERHGYS
jgi:hypothetical protein